MLVSYTVTNNEDFEKALSNQLKDYEESETYYNQKIDDQVFMQLTEEEEEEEEGSYIIIELSFTQTKSKRTETLLLEVEKIDQKDDEVNYSLTF